MRVNPQLMIPQTITLVNRHKAKDNGTGKDVFYKKVLVDCVWNATHNARNNGNSVTYTSGISVQIPTAQVYTYFDYSIWKNVENLEDCFTFSLDDYVFLGELAEDVTPNNIHQLIQAHKGKVFQIKRFDDLSLSDGSFSSKGGFLMKYASIYYVEGE